MSPYILDKRGGLLTVLEYPPLSTMSEPEQLERRPNPAGWVQPKAPYNPYDPADRRPAKGYPSEFDAPGTMKQNSGRVAQDATDYAKIRVDMKKLQYFPRPPSELYPGRHKVLRRVKHLSRFDKGATFIGKASMWGITIFGVFFYKWNDHDNIFSPFRRLQLRFKEILLGGLSPEDYHDVYHYDRDKPIPQKPLPSIMYEQNETDHLVGNEETNNEFIKDRFGIKHVVHAEHLQQKDEENLMKALDLAQREIQAKQLKEQLGQQNDRPIWKFWKFW